MLLTTKSEIFAGTTVVYIPTRGSRKAQWVTPKTCVWEAPKFLSVKYSLANAGHYRDSSRLKHLFNAILEIRNAGWIEYLLQIKAESLRRMPRLELSTVYSHILEDVSVDSIWDIIQ